MVRQNSTRKHWRKSSIFGKKKNKPKNNASCWSAWLVPLTHCITKISSPAKDNQSSVLFTYVKHVIRTCLSTRQTHVKRQTAFEYRVRKRFFFTQPWRRGLTASKWLPRGQSILIYRFFSYINRNEKIPILCKASTKFVLSWGKHWT